MTGLFLVMAGRLPMLCHCHQSHRDRCRQVRGCFLSGMRVSVCWSSPCLHPQRGIGLICRRRSGMPKAVESKPCNAELQQADRCQANCREVASKPGSHPSRARSRHCRRPSAQDATRFAGCFSMRRVPGAWIRSTPSQQASALTELCWASSRWPGAFCGDALVAGFTRLSMSVSAAWRMVDGMVDGWRDRKAGRQGRESRVAWKESQPWRVRLPAFLKTREKVADAKGTTALATTKDIGAARNFRPNFMRYQGPD